MPQRLTSSIIWAKIGVHRFGSPETVHTRKSNIGGKKGVMFNLLAVDNSQGDTQFNTMVQDVLNIVNNYVIRGALIIGVIVLAVFLIINAVKYYNTIKNLRDTL